MHIVNINGSQDTTIYTNLVDLGHLVETKTIDEFIVQAEHTQADLLFVSKEYLTKEDILQLRQSIRNDWLPIVFIADPKYPENILPAINNGADDFMFKTIQSTELQAKCVAYGKIRAQMVNYNQTMQELKINNEVNFHYALHDKLTGLANRDLFNSHFYRCVARSARSSHYLALLFIDLDDFKIVNDKYGHIYGDKLLQVIAKRLLTSVRKSDMIARFGGDEFLILISDLDEASIAQKTAQHILDNFKTPFVVNEQSILLSCSIGIALYPLHAKNASDLISKADQAMYAAKLQGKNCFFVA